MTLQDLMETLQEKIRLREFNLMDEIYAEGSEEDSDQVRMIDIRKGDCGTVIVTVDHCFGGSYISALEDEF